MSVSTESEDFSMKPFGIHPKTLLIIFYTLNMFNVNKNR